jgi:hypothetical protein
MKEQQRKYNRRPRSEKEASKEKEEQKMSIRALFCGSETGFFPFSS